MTLCKPQRNSVSDGGKTTFEKRKNISNVVFLRCLVVFKLCGRVYEACVNEYSGTEIIIDNRLKGNFRRPFLTTGRHFRGLGKYIKISVSQKRKFYYEINFFIYEITSRLLRDKFFYLVVEFFLLPRELFPVPRELRLIPRELFLIRMKIIFHPHENSFSSA
jgi:hypothetical protein